MRKNARSARKKYCFVMSDRLLIQELRDECCRLIDDHLPHFQECRREALKSLVQGFVEGCVFYLVQGLCDYYEKSLATGERFLSKERFVRVDYRSQSQIRALFLSVCSPELSFRQFVFCDRRASNIWFRKCADLVMNGYVP